MNIETHEETIGDRKVMVTQFAALDAAGILADLSRIAAPVLEILDSVTSAADLMESNVDIGSALSKVLRGLNSSQAKELITTLLQQTSINNGEKLIKCSNKHNIDMAFGADLNGLVAACTFSLRVNYGPTFAVAQEKFKGIIARVKAAANESTSPKMSAMAG